MSKKRCKNRGSIELIVLGLLAALIVVLAIPLLKTLGANTQNNLNSLNTNVE